MPRIATADRVERDALEEFVRPRHHAILVTTRADGRPQLSPVTCGLDTAGRIVIATYPQRVKVRNARRDPRVSVLVSPTTGTVPGCRSTARPRSSTCRTPSSRSSSTSG